MTLRLERAEGQFTMVQRDAHLLVILVSSLQHIKYMALMRLFLVLNQFHIMIFLLFSKHELAGNITSKFKVKYCPEFADHVCRL